MPKHLGVHLWQSLSLSGTVGLNFGIDFNTPALRLPGIGRLGFPQD